MFGIEFAPLKIPLRRRLQTASILVYCLSFLVVGPVCCILAIVLLFTRWWWVTVLYACWVILYDIETPERGGRRLQCVRDWIVCKLAAEYFPIELIKTAELDPKKNYIFGHHPHGVLATSAFLNFSSEATGFSKKFPGIRSHLLMLTGFLWMPWHRDYVMTSGGATESLDAMPGKCSLTIKRRKGFIRMAIKHGADLVPVYSFGENEMYTQVNNPPGSFLRTLQTKMQRFTGYAPVLFYGRGIVPYRIPIHTVVGVPISVEKNENHTEEEVDALQQKYIQGLIDLFDKHKGLYGMEDHELDIQ